MKLSRRNALKAGVAGVAGFLGLPVEGRASADSQITMDGLTKANALANASVEEISIAVQALPVLDENDWRELQEKHRELSRSSDFVDMDNETCRWVVCDGQVRFVGIRANEQWAQFGL